MLLENFNNSYMTIVVLLSFLIFVIILKIFNQKNFQVFMDNDFKKPQAFHKKLTPRIGGLASILAMVLFYISFNLIFDFKNLDYLFFSILFFILGFLDDSKVTLKPSARLTLMIIVLIIGINFFDIKISRTGFDFLNNLLENSIFMTFFVILCFLFIINGANLIDGFNGLVIIHLIIINSVLLFLNLNNGFDNFDLFLTGQLFVMFCFLLFNFPEAKMFLGDGGAYFLGLTTALNTINTSLVHPDISPIYFIILLFYLFFEVFFSFIRKIKLKQSPLKPDSKHLHMLLYKYLKKKKFKSSNPITAISINLTYFLLIFPMTIFYENNILCKIWFIFLICAYLFFYYFLNKVTKKN